MLKELAEYIEDETSLTVGTDLFAGIAPPSVEGLIVILENRDPGVRNGHYDLRDFGQTPFRAVVRGAVRAGYFTVKDLADTVFTALHGSNQITLPVVDSGPTYLVNITCSDPYYIGKDDKGRDMVVVNAIVSREEI